MYLNSIGPKKNSLEMLIDTWDLKEVPIKDFYKKIGIKMFKNIKTTDLKKKAKIFIQNSYKNIVYNNIKSIYNDAIVNDIISLNIFFFKEKDIQNNLKYKIIENYFKIKKERV